MLYDVNNQTPTPEKYDPKVKNNFQEVSATLGQKIAVVIFYLLTIGLGYIWKIVKINHLKKLQIKINQGASNIDVQLQKRFDTLNKLLDSVKAQAKFDKQTLESITNLRTGNHHKTLNEKAGVIDQMSKAINIAVEAYPQLGVDQSITTMMNEAALIEREISASRRVYNANVTDFNSLIYTFPINVFVCKLHYVGVQLFVTHSQAREDVKIDF